jgi:hypothetical protein
MEFKMISQRNSENQEDHLDATTKDKLNLIENRLKNIIPRINLYCEQAKQKEQALEHFIVLQKMLGFYYKSILAIESALLTLNDAINKSGNTELIQQFSNLQKLTQENQQQLEAHLKSINNLHTIINYTETKADKMQKPESGQTKPPSGLQSSRFFSGQTALLATAVAMATIALNYQLPRP